jgi:redox-sensitive bicupin YhaK (pirin superfamily)
MATTKIDAGRKVLGTVPGTEMMEGAGVRIRRYIAGPHLSLLDPFLLLDEFKSPEERDYVAGFPPHPHRGFETVTYMVKGRSRHKDSTGAEGVLEPGDVQWMTAGRGVVHSEMPELAEGGVWGYQLWVNLPARLKMTGARYQDIPSATIPEVAFEGGVARVIAGQFDGIDGAADSVTGVTYLDLHLEAGATCSYRLSPTANAFVLPVGGAVSIGGASDLIYEPRRLAVLDAGPGVVISVAQTSRLLLVAGEPLGEPVARGGPFVMNTEAEIRQAFSDYRSGLMGRVA